MYTVGKDSFGQCGIKPGELISNPTRVTSVSLLLLLLFIIVYYFVTNKYY